MREESFGCGRGFSLPVFGEGGRAELGRVGATGSVVPWRRPYPALPEDGEGEESGRPCAAV